MNIRLLSFLGLLLLSSQLMFVAQAAPASADALKTAQKALATAPVPAGVRSEIWKLTIKQLGSTNILNLSDHNLASVEFTAIINALPPVISQSITTLEISTNKLTTLPDAIGNLTSLQELSVGNNKLIALPNTIGNLTALKELYVFNNHLSMLPDTIGNLTALQTLNAYGNQLTTLPKAIGGLIALQGLFVPDNQLTLLPDTIGNLTALQQLSVGNNPLTALPDTLSKLTALKELYVNAQVKVPTLRPEIQIVA